MALSKHNIKIVKTLKITGAVFSKPEDKLIAEKLNFDKVVSGIENNFSRWKCRILSVLARTTVIKAQA